MYVNGLRDGRSATFLAVLVGAPFLVTAASVSVAASLTPSASLTAERRDRLPVGRSGWVTTVVCPPVSSVLSVPSPAALSRSSLTACLSSGSFGGHYPVSTLVEYSVEQGRQDLNLQPAVLETAALPVELRPFRM